MAWTVGIAASESFPIPSLATGQTFTRVDSYINGSASTFAPTFTEISGGSYRYSYTPAVAGPHEWIGTTTNGDMVTINETAIPAAADPAALATAIAGVQSSADALSTDVAAVQSDVTTVKAMTDVATSTRATPGSYITTGSATATSGAATVYQGDDQVAVASRSLDWSTTTADQWPDLTGATILLSGQHRTNAANTISAAGLVVTPTGATKHVRVELLHAVTEALKEGAYEIQVIATLTGGEVVTIIDTTMTVKARKGP